MKRRGDTATRRRGDTGKRLMMWTRLVGLFLLFGLLTGCHGSTAQSAMPARSEETNQEKRDQSGSDPLTLPLINPAIEVQKAARKLLLYSAGRVVRSYHIGLGLSPEGDKQREGDRRTPEGEFYVFTKNPKSSYYLSLGISYPNLAHAERGLREGLITLAQYDRIVAALKRRVGPPQNTPLGGLIYIHGNGARTDWTWGCVALEDGDIRELFAAVTVGTPVTIQP